MWSGPLMARQHSAGSRFCWPLLSSIAVLLAFILWTTPWQSSLGVEVFDAVRVADVAIGRDAVSRDSAEVVTQGSPTSASEVGTEAGRQIEEGGSQLVPSSEAAKTTAVGIGHPPALPLCVVAAVPSSQRGGVQAGSCASLRCHRPAAGGTSPAPASLRDHCSCEVSPPLRLRPPAEQAAGTRLPAHALDLFALLGSHGEGGRSSGSGVVEALHLQRSKLAAESSHHKANGARSDSKGLIAYQKQVFQLFADLPRGACNGKDCERFLADAYINKEWLRSYKKLAPELGAVFIPLLWKKLTDDWPWTKSSASMQWRRKLVAAWQQLDHSRLHFVVLMQSNLLQLEGALRANSLPMINMTNVIVFDSRGNDSIPAFPIPLLHHATMNVSEAERTISVSFRGSCTDRGTRIRHTLSDLFANFSGSRVARCGEKSKSFGDELRSSVFSLAPPGSFPTSFRQFEAIQVGALPIVLGDRTYFGGTLWLPFQDLGVDWNSLGFALTEDELPGLPARLRAVLDDPASLRARLDRAKQVAALFTPAGVLEYVLYVMTFYASTAPGSFEQVLSNACISGLLAREAVGKVRTMLP
mmetsp:Transcript_161038/g.516920  ORF Transcript_161038/g.516920 Transcript_161038/m.516920 type:complete len:584 (-) Transcript_161038:146-1897(-)